MGAVTLSFFGSAEQPLPPGHPLRFICSTCLFELVTVPEAALPSMKRDLKLIWDHFDYPHSSPSSEKHHGENIVDTAPRVCTTCAVIKGFVIQTLEASNLVLPDDRHPLRAQWSFSKWRPRENLWCGDVTRDPLLDHDKADLEVRPSDAFCDNPLAFEFFLAPDDLSIPPSELGQHVPWLKARRECKGTTRDALDLAGDWLQHCLAHHSGKCNTRDPGFVPTRLLDTGTDGTDTILLVDRPQTPHAYATLSHRWNDGIEEIKLVQSNLAQRITTGMAISSLTQLFRDVIEVLRRLHIRYVWIDCLCIIQDSENDEDWRHEAAQMGAVYQNSTLTIAAVWCTSSGQSLFSEPRRSQVVSDKGQHPVLIRRRLQHFSYDARSYLRAEEEHANWPLFSRGWVYQERMLSPRLLHFTRDELVWECMSTSTCECTPREGIDFQCSHRAPEMAEVEHMDRAAVDVTALADGKRAFFNDDQDQEWSQIVDNYCKLNLTYEKDRLPALASIARDFGRSRGWRYICGMWAEEFSTAFDWSSFDALGLARNLRPRVRGPWPSWSWASVWGGIDLANRPGFSGIPRVTELTASIKSIQIDYSGDIYMGEASSGRITLSAPVFNATLVYGSDWKVIAEKYNAVQGRGNIGGLVMQDKASGFYPDYKLWHPDEFFVPSPSEVTCLVFRTSGRGEVAECLVLYRDESSYPNYRRVGRCQSFRSRWLEGPVDTSEVTLI